MQKKTSECGFTILELGLALAILAILVLVAVVSFYDHQERRSRQLAAQRLLEVAEWMNAQRATTPDYQSMLPPGWATQDSDDNYQISLLVQPLVASDPKGAFPVLSGSGFTLKATPKDPDDCGALLVDHEGRRGVTGVGAKVSDCWP